MRPLLGRFEQTKYYFDICGHKVQYHEPSNDDNRHIPRLNHTHISCYHQGCFYCRPHGLWLVNCHPSWFLIGWWKKHTYISSCHVATCVLGWWSHLYELQRMPFENFLIWIEKWPQIYANNSHFRKSVESGYGIVATSTYKLKNYICLINWADVIILRQSLVIT